MNDGRLERSIGLVLGAGAIVSVCLLAVGLAGMGVAHVGSLDRPFPPFDLNRLGSDLCALKPAGFLWLGLLAVILTPSVRVLASLFGFAAAGERRMVAVAAIVLAAICLSAALGAGG